MAKNHHSQNRGASLKTDSHENITQSGASALESNKDLGISHWFVNHKLAFKRASFQIMNNKFATIITILVIASALTLPAMFQIISSNLQGKDDKLAQHSGISVFLKTGQTQDTIDNFIQRIKQQPAVKNVEFISAEQALLEFQQSVGISSDALLRSNPIPPLVYLQPETNPQSVEQIKQLKNWLQSQEETDVVQVDIDWIERLFSIAALLQNASILLSLFLIFTVLVIIGNTIRLLAQHYYDEILISKLMGATDAYVRRPFLYSGFLFGLSGGITACLFVYLGFLWLQPEINRVIDAYGSQVTFSGLNFADTLSLLSIGALLGIGAAWIASNRIINEISI